MLLMGRLRMFGHPTAPYSTIMSFETPFEVEMLGCSRLRKYHVVDLALNRPHLFPPQIPVSFNAYIQLTLKSRYSNVDGKIFGNDNSGTCGSHSNFTGLPLLDIKRILLGSSKPLEEDFGFIHRSLTTPRQA